MHLSKSMKLPFAALLLSSAVVLPGLASASPGEPGEPGAGRPDRRARLERRMDRRAHRRQALRFLKRLELTDAQREGIRAAREATKGVREALRDDVRAVFQEARAAAKKGGRTPEMRAAVREKIRAARQAAIAKVEPQARGILDSLTSDQRAKLLEAAAKRAKDGVVSDADLVRRIGRLLVAPGHRHGRSPRAETTPAK